MMMVMMNTITIYSSDDGNADDSNDGDDNTNDITDGDDCHIRTYIHTYMCANIARVTHVYTYIHMYICLNVCNFCTYVGLVCAYINCTPDTCV